MMTNKPVSLYIHIPFCVKKCDYCAFYSLPAQSDELKQAYFEALIRQINLFPNDREIYSVYFGGGTPPALSANRLCKLIELISSRFKLIDGCEITVEVNPGAVDLVALKALRMSGANRLSIGIQSANDRILSSIGRIHSFDDALECISNARKAGFENLSVDVIFALPNQSTEEFADGLSMIMSTRPNHISAYSLQLEEGTPLYQKRKNFKFPDEDGEEEQYKILCELTAENGYRHYEISSFAMDGCESRHNMNYWSRGEYFGFGAAAHSFCFGKRFSAQSDIAAYIENCTSLLAPTDYDEAEFISNEEGEEERILLGLRTANGALIPEKAHCVAERIAKLGFGKFENGILSLNSKGFRVSNEIISEILIQKADV